MKIALVGDAVSTRHRAPFGDGTWEIWTTGNSYTHVKRATRYFELHDWADVSTTIKADKVVQTDGGIETNFWDAPMKLGCTHIYTGAEVPDRFTRRPDGTPSVERFPFDEMQREYPYPYFTSSFAWIIAFAISLGPEELGFYGIDLSIDEYVTQKGAIEHFAGIAIGRGIKVTVDPRSMMLRTPFLYALETKANRHARSVLMDQRVIIEHEMKVRQIKIDQNYTLRMASMNRMDEHKFLCKECGEKPCERARLIRQDFYTAVKQQVDADLEFAQIRARLDENTYYLHHLVIEDNYGPDQDREDKGMPVLAAPQTDKYQGVGHRFPLPKEISIDIDQKGDINYEIADAPSLTEVRAVVNAKDGA